MYYRYITNIVLKYKENRYSSVAKLHLSYSPIINFDFSLNFLKKGLKQNKFVVTWLVYALKNFEVIAKAAKWREWVVGQS